MSDECYTAHVMISMFSPGFEVVKLGRYWLSKTYTIRRIERRCRRVKLSNLLKNYNATNKWILNCPTVHCTTHIGRNRQEQSFHCRRKTLKMYIMKFNDVRCIIEGDKGFNSMNVNNLAKCSKAGVVICLQEVVNVFKGAWSRLNALEIQF